MGIDKVLFWDSTGNPPKFDKQEWSKYKILLKHYPGALFIIDTLRSAQGKDENNSQDMTEIMGRLRELRDLGATILLLHHTPKSNETKYKGSSAIFDMSDQILALYPVKRGTEEEVDEDDDVDKVYRFGTKDKTRYKPFKTFLSFNPDTELFEIAPDPDEELLEQIHHIMIELRNRTGTAPNQKAIVEEARKENIPEKKVRGILNKGQGRYWTQERGNKNAKVYEPNFCLAKNLPIYSCQTAEQEAAISKEAAKQTHAPQPQNIDNTESVSLAVGIGQTEKLDLYEGTI